MKNLLNIAAEDLFQIQTSYRRPEPNKLGNILCMTLKIYGIKQDLKSPYDTKPLKVLNQR
jgi:hypothetical protein